MFLLDTNHCSRIMEGDDGVLAQLDRVGDSQVVTAAIVRGELIYMAHMSRDRESNLNRVKDFLRDISIFDVDQETADIYGEFKADLLRKFGPRQKAKRESSRLGDIGISENDLWIACVALRNDLAIISADRDFVRMRQVRDFPLESWWIPSGSRSDRAR